MSDQGRALSLVVVVGPFPPPTHGAAIITQRLTQRLKGRAAIVVVDTSPASHRRTVGTHARRFVCHAQAVVALARHARRARRSLYVACPGGRAIWYVTTLVAIGRALGYQTFVHHHSFSYLDRGSRAMALLTRLGSRSVTHVSLCTRMEGELRKRYPKVENAVVCSNAAFVTPLPAVAQRPNRSGLVLGHLGNLTFEKGLEEVLELLRTLRGTGLPVTLRLAGEPMSPDVAATVRAAQRELGSALVVEGPATGAEKDRFFSSIDLFVLPSRYVHEAEPLVVLEALAAGTPIVAIGRGCLADGFSGAGRITDTSEDFVRIAAQYCRSLAEDGRGLDDQRRAVSAGFRRRRGAAEKALSDLVAVITAERERE